MLTFVSQLCWRLQWPNERTHSHFKTITENPAFFKSAWELIFSQIGRHINPYETHQFSVFQGTSGHKCFLFSLWPAGKPQIKRKNYIICVLSSASLLDLLSPCAFLFTSFRLHFPLLSVNKGTLLRFSLPITEEIVRNVANQRKAFVIEC